MIEGSSSDHCRSELVHLARAAKLPVVSKVDTPPPPFATLAGAEAGFSNDVSH